jgi:hypothetical protein
MTATFNRLHGKLQALNCRLCRAQRHARQLHALIERAEQEHKISRAAHKLNVRGVAADQTARKICTGEFNVLCHLSETKSDAAARVESGVSGSPSFAVLTETKQWSAWAQTTAAPIFTESQLVKMRTALATKQRELHDEQTNLDDLKSRYVRALGCVHKCRRKIHQATADVAVQVAHERAQQQAKSRLQLQIAANCLDDSSCIGLFST